MRGAFVPRPCTYSAPRVSRQLKTGDRGFPVCSSQARQDERWQASPMPLIVTPAERRYWIVSSSTFRTESRMARGSCSTRWPSRYAGGRTFFVWYRTWPSRLRASALVELLPWSMPIKHDRSITSSCSALNKPEMHLVYTLSWSRSNFISLFSSLLADVCACSARGG